MPNEEQMRKVKEIVAYALNVLDSTIQYEGILLCEGTFTSVDVRLYQKVYPSLLVIPIGGCSDIIKLFVPIKKRMCGYSTFGLIDRDALSKSEVRRLRKMGIYCTKLPFIENIISAPEIIRILCKEKGCDYEESTFKIRAKLLHILSRKLRDALPINIPIGENEPITSITIRIKKCDGTFVEKTVDENNIIYSYRDKAVANETADVLRIVGRKKYYDFFIKSLENPEISEKIVHCASAYLPEIEL